MVSVTDKETPGAQLTLNHGLTEKQPCAHARQDLAPAFCLSGTRQFSHTHCKCGKAPNKPCIKQCCLTDKLMHLKHISVAIKSGIHNIFIIYSFLSVQIPGFNLFFFFSFHPNLELTLSHYGFTFVELQ